MALPELTLPATVRITGIIPTPNEMRQLAELTERSLGDLFGDSDDGELLPDRMQAMIWIALRRAGHDPSWEQAGDVIPDTSEVPPDPTPTASSNSSSISAGTGI